MKKKEIITALQEQVRQLNITHHENVSTITKLNNKISHLEKYATHLEERLQQKAGY